MSVATTRAAYKTRLATISGLNTFDSWPDTNEINLPCAWVHGPLSRVLDTENGGVTRTWEVMLVVASSEDQRRYSQARLDPYLEESGAQSVIAALESGGETIVTAWADYGVNEVAAEAAYWGVKFLLEEIDG